ncbi:MAG: EamA family transporter [Porphyrobacter sp.]|nr:EamA family transporter [Porphyrobacter sp.]
MSPVAFGVLLVVVSTMVEGFGQTFLKKSAIDVARRHRWILLGIAVLIVEVLLYSGALRFLAVSTAFPITSLSFVMVTLLSRWLLGEQVTPLRWAGVGLILIGTSLIVAQA